MAQRVRRRILVPISIDGKLRHLAGLKQESNGALLYVPTLTSDGLNCRVDALYMTAVGTAGNVCAEPQRMAIINRFFESNPEYRFVKWHTHCRGTGEYWFTRFSQGDIRAYKEQLRQDSRFIGMVVSPTRKLLYGKGIVELALMLDTSNSQRRERQVQGELQTAARELGYDDLPPLQANSSGIS